MTPYVTGFNLVQTAESPRQLSELAAAAEATLRDLYAHPTLRKMFKGVADALKLLETISSNPTNNTNIDDTMSLEQSIQNLADANNAVAAAILTLAAANGATVKVGGLTAKVTAVTTTTPAAVAKGGNTDALAKARAAKAEKEAKEKADAEAAAAEEAALLGGDAGSEPTVTLEELRGLGAELVKAKKMTELKALLAKFKVPSLTELPKEQWDEMHSELSALAV